MFSTITCSVLNVGGLGVFLYRMDIKYLEKMKGKIGLHKQLQINLEIKLKSTSCFLPYPTSVGVFYGKCFRRNRIFLSQSFFKTTVNLNLIVFNLEN